MMTKAPAKYARQKARREENEDRDLAMYRYWLTDEYSLKTIGEMYGVSPARVDQIVKRIAAERGVTKK